MQDPRPHPPRGSRFDSDQGGTFRGEGGGAAVSLPASGWGRGSAVEDGDGGDRGVRDHPPARGSRGATTPRTGLRGSRARKGALSPTAPIKGPVPPPSPARTSPGSGQSHHPSPHAVGPMGLSPPLPHPWCSFGADLPPPHQKDPLHPQNRVPPTQFTLSLSAWCCFPQGLQAAIQPPPVGGPVIVTFEEG